MKITNEKKFRLALRMFCKAAKHAGLTFEQFVEIAQQEWEKA